MFEMKRILSVINGEAVECVDGSANALLQKRRQFQKRGPDSPRQRNANNEPVNEKLAKVSSGFGLVSHVTLLRFSILSVNIIPLVHWTHGQIADQSNDEQPGH
jgi:hypothetical protein